MFALDSKNEYADLINVYNAKASDEYYCPICLGKVKLWYGQDPNKVYKKQRHFHHLDCACSIESRIHFAYKTWLLNEGSKFIVDGNIYAVKEAEVEKTFHTQYGDYRPDIYIVTDLGKEFYIEIANTSKKTDDYIMKWDALENDVLELDVNEQLVATTDNNLPVFKLIYSSTSCECFIKKYVRSDYEDMISECKQYWKREDILNYKIRWESLDSFWLILQKYCVNQVHIDCLVNAFVTLDPIDQRFICKKLKGKKHRSIKNELELHYTNKDDREKAFLKQIDSIIRNLNHKYEFSTIYGKPYLRRQGWTISFVTRWPSWYGKNPYKSMRITCETHEDDIASCFHNLMNREHQKHLKEIEEKKQWKIKQLEKVEKLNSSVLPVIQKYSSFFAGNQNWKFEYDLDNSCLCPEYNITILLLDTFQRKLSINLENIDHDNIDQCIKQKITSVMNYILEDAKDADYWKYIRVMEERK